MRPLILGLSALAGFSSAIDVQVASSGGNATSGKQYGIMFEDINHSGDGGIYAELIRNRAFQGNSIRPSTIQPWTAIGSAQLSLKNLSQPLSPALPTSLNVAASSGTVGIVNPGFWGIEVKVQKYTGSFWVKGSYDGSFTISLQSTITNETLGSLEVRSNSTDSEWREHTFTLTPEKAAASDIIANNTFAITYDASATSGSLDFNLISLFPPTYNNRPNGMRSDLMENLKGLNPSFLRFPGGNNLEGNDPPYYLKWNETIGPLKDRPGFPGTWGYQNTNGLGLIEYLHWCDDLNMEPVLAVWAGFYLEGPVIPENALQPYIDDALNELEFLMGDTSTTYGALRASLGYPEPWTIKYVEIGNEDNLGGGGTSYQSYRFQKFYDAIRAKYPDMVVFASTVDYQFAETSDAGEDYHEYTRPDVFAGRFGFFDTFATGYKTIIGEYAVVQPNIPQGGGVDWSGPRWRFPMWIGTVAEAVFLVGAERNADKIFGAAYAPLFQNLNSYQWAPDLISYSADTAANVLSTSYHMIQLFSEYRITETLPVENAEFDPAFYVVGRNNETGSYIVKAAVYNSTELVPMSVTFEGVTEGAQGTLTVLTAEDALSYSNVGKEAVTTTTTSVIAGSGGVFEFELPDLSISVLEVKA
ncbi:glycoside hydrolase family 51 protein [Zopfia rhizophila CBS 207.26]|uniref:non-reducing end alpha-L-arabinofuranosidase n=1 Tax=Zopfia rhizophila CBS 207.26 TaxID=1314779 RepID=A0A6A6DW16_9PEZI|nr:glycoside hydrolase family 51 protein [Zopfia rhizophila CBS 207.26]